MTDRELLQMALDALITAEIDGNCEYGVTDSLRTRLAQNDFNPDWDAMAVMVEEQKRMAKRIEELEGQLVEQEPVAWMEFEGYMDEDGLMSERKVLHTWDNGKGEPLYTAPPQREWQGLTDEEMNECWGTVLTSLGMRHARAIEAKLKEKNT